jgi:putative tricarboxylic transport membrane protein
MNRDIILGAAGIAAAAVYWGAADALPSSLLSDEVGADGVPKALAVSLGALSALVLARALALAPRPAAIGVTVSGGAGVKGGAAAHLWAGGVVGVAALYILAAPFLGYVLALGLLIAATAMLFGMRPGPRLSLVAAGGAALFWVLFAKVLGVALPAGWWPRLWS